MTDKQANYLAYLLRLWREESDGQPTWRASLELPGPGKRRAFASLEALFAFLETKTGQAPPKANDSPDGTG